MNDLVEPILIVHFCSYIKKRIMKKLIHLTESLSNEIFDEY